MSDITYYFNHYLDASCFWTDRNYMIDSSITTFGYISTGGGLCQEDGNSCPGTNLGTITKIEIRVYGYGDGGDKIGLEPIFSAGLGTEVEHVMPLEASKDWSSYQDITIDTNAPSPWTWSAVQGLDLNVRLRAQGKANAIYSAKTEIRVTYTPTGGVTRSYGYILG